MPKVPVSKIEQARTERLIAIVEARLGRARVIASSDRATTGESLWIVRGTRRSVRFAWVPPKAIGPIRDHVVFGTVSAPDGIARVDSLTVEPAPVTARCLRSIPVADLLRKVLRELQEVTRDDGTSGPFPRVVAMSQARYRNLAESDSKSGDGRGRPPLGDDFLFRVARAYLLVTKDGTNGGRARLAADLSKRLDRDVSVELARSWTEKARVRGFLAATTPGRAAAIAGPRFEDFTKRKATK